MSAPFFEYPINELHLSYSSEKTFDTCASKIEFLKFFNMPRTIDGDIVAMEVGKTLHIGYQTWLRERDWDKAQFDCAMNYPIDQNPSPSDGRSLEAAIKSLKKMVEHPKLIPHDLVDIQCADGEVRPALEVPFQLRVKNFYLDTAGKIPVFYDGFIDGITYNVSEEEYVVIDVKTHRRFNIKNSDWTPMFANHTQCLPYAFVLQHIRQKPIKTLKVIYIAVFVDFNDPIVRVHTITKTKEDIQDWVKSFWKMLNDIKLYYQMQWFKKNGEACMSFGNKCFAYDLCAGVHNKEFVKKSIDLIEVDQSKVWQRPEPWVKAELDLGIEV